MYLQFVYCNVHKVTSHSFLYPNFIISVYVQYCTTVEMLVTIPGNSPACCNSDIGLDKRGTEAEDS